MTRTFAAAPAHHLSTTIVPPDSDAVLSASNTMTALDRAVSQTGRHRRTSLPRSIDRRGCVHMGNVAEHVVLQRGADAQHAAVQLVSDARGALNGVASWSSVLDFSPLPLPSVSVGHLKGSREAGGSGLTQSLGPASD